MSLYNNITIKKMTYDSQKVKKWIHNGVQVFSAGIIVTYICNGNTYNEEVMTGASCLSPKTFTPSRSGMTFLGWSSSAGSTDTLSSLVAGDTNITLYAVFKYNDISIAPTKSQYTKGGNWGAGTWSSESNPLATLYTGINFSLYNAITFTVGDLNIGQAHEGKVSYIYLHGGGVMTKIGTCSKGYVLAGGNIVSDLPKYNYTITHNFSSVSGIGNVYVTDYGSTGVPCDFHLYFPTNATLTGRSIVG